MVSLNLRRRHLSEGQRACTAAQIAKLPLGANQFNGSASLPTEAEAAAVLNVTERGVRIAAVVRDRGTPELQNKVASGLSGQELRAQVPTLSPFSGCQGLADGQPVRLRDGCASHYGLADRSRKVPGYRAKYSPVCQRPRNHVIIKLKRITAFYETVMDQERVPWLGNG